MPSSLVTTLNINPGNYNSLQDLVTEIIDDNASISISALARHLGTNPHILRNILSEKDYYVYPQTLRSFEHSLRIRPFSLDSLVEIPISHSRLRESTTIGEAIHYIRECKHLTLERFGKLTGRAATLIYSYEKNARRPRQDYIEYIAKIFNIPADLFNKFYPRRIIMDYEEARGIDHFGQLLKYVLAANNITQLQAAVRLGMGQRRLDHLFERAIPTYYWRKNIKPGKIKMVFKLREDLFRKFYPEPEDLKMNKFKNLGQAIHYYRSQLGITMDELARRLGKTREAIRQYEANIIFPKNNNSRDFQHALGLKQDVFAMYFLKKSSYQ